MTCFKQNFVCALKLTLLGALLTVLGGCAATLESAPPDVSSAQPLGVVPASELDWRKLPHQITLWRISGRVKHLTIVLTAPHNPIPLWWTRTSIPSPLAGRPWTHSCCGTHLIGLASGS